MAKQKTGGRKKGGKNKRTVALEAAAKKGGKLPLDYMLEVMRDAKADTFAATICIPEPGAVSLVSSLPAAALSSICNCLQFVSTTRYNCVHSDELQAGRF